MCGILGFSSEKGFTSDVVAIKSLFLYNNAERGGDGTGIWSPETGLIKSKQSFTELAKSHPEAFNTASEVVIGHVRKRSFGTIDDESAQPFLEKISTEGVCKKCGKEHWLAGVHNGHISNHLALKQSYCKGMVQVSQTDSHGFYQALSAANCLDPLSEYEGGAALLFADDTNVLYAFRDESKSLYRGKRWDGMYISSIKESLDLIQCEDVIEFLSDRLYVISQGKVTYTIPIDRTKTTYSETYGYYESSRNLDSPQILNKIHSIFDYEGKWGQWNMLDTYAVAEDKGKYGDWYYCENIERAFGLSNKAKLTLTNFKEIINWVTNENYWFACYQYRFTINQKLVAMVELKDTKTKETTAIKGQTVRLTSFDITKGTCTVTNIFGEAINSHLKYYMPELIYTAANDKLHKDDFEYAGCG